MQALATSRRRAGYHPGWGKKGDQRALRCQRKGSAIDLMRQKRKESSGERLLLWSRAIKGEGHPHLTGERRERSGERGGGDPCTRVGETSSKGEKGPRRQIAFSQSGKGGKHRRVPGKGEGGKEGESEAKEKKGAKLNHLLERPKGNASLVRRGKLEGGKKRKKRITKKRAGFLTTTPGGRGGEKHFCGHQLPGEGPQKGHLPRDIREKRPPLRRERIDRRGKRADYHSYEKRGPVSALMKKKKTAGKTGDDLCPRLLKLDEKEGKRDDP